MIKTQTVQQLEAIQAALEDDAQALRNKVAKACERAVKQQLAIWNKRFPRHMFTAWDRMGMMEIEVHPTVCGERLVSDLHYSRTESTLLAELAAEARQLIDAWNAIEAHIGANFYSDGTITATDD